MRPNQLPLWGLLVALLLGLRVGGPGSQSPHNSPAPDLPYPKQGAIKASATRSEPLPPVWRVLCKINPDYASTSYLAQRKSLEAVSNKWKEPSCLDDRQDHVKIVSIIATVPDPVHTHLGLGFDRVVDAVQTAAAQDSFLPFMHALPWPPPRVKQLDSSQPEATSEYEFPGLLLFRKSSRWNSDPNDAGDSASIQYLAVFLVPELPSSGIDRASFLSAVRIVRKISPDSIRGGISMLGPSFSGSVSQLPELRRAIGTELKTASKNPHSMQEELDPCLQAISGSVTNASDPFRSRPNPNGCPRAFMALQTSDPCAITALVDGLGESNGYKPGEIALLTEEGTEYGNVADHIRPAEATGQPGQECSLRKDVLLLHFPREISKLRNAYAPSSSSSQPENTGTDYTAALPLNWQDPYPLTSDDVRNYGQQTALSEETVLASLASVIKSQRMKALAILATDPLDTVFLIHSFKKSCPDVRIFLRDPDLLYLRTPDVGSMNGVMTVNNFPLVPEIQFWNAPQGDIHHLISFPSSAQEADYAAFRLLLRYRLWHLPLELPERAPFAALDGEFPGQARRSFDDWQGRKPLWLGVTGTAGYYPVRILNAPTNLEAASLRSLKIGRPPYATILVALFIAFVGALHAMWATFPKTVPSRFDEEFDFKDKRDSINVAKGFCHVIALLSLSLAGVLVTSSFCFFRDAPYLIGFSWLPINVYRIASLCAEVLIIALVSAAGWRLFDSVLRPYFSFAPEQFSNNDVIRVSTLVRSLPVALAIFALPIVFWFVEAFETTYDNAFLHYRDLYLASGVAPVLPGLLLVTIAYMGTLAYVRRVAYWEYGSVKTPVLQLDDTFPSDFQPSMKCIDGWMLGIPATSALRVGLFAIVFVGSILALRPWATLDTLELAWAQCFLVAGFIFALFVMSVNWIRFIVIWCHLKAILCGLEKLPLRLAFSRLPRENSLPIWSWSIHDGTFLPIVQAVDTFRALVRIAPAAISRDCEERLRLGVLALENPRELAEHAKDHERSLISERKAVEFIAEERKRIVNAERQRKAFAMTADGSRPIPLTSVDPPRAQSISVGTGNVTEIRPSNTPGEVSPPESNDFSPKMRKQTMHEMRQAMTEVISELSLLLVREYWSRGGLGLRKGSDKFDPADEKYVLAEDLVAIRFYSFIRYVVCELRSLLFFMAFSFPLLFLSLHVYSFRADQGIDWCFIVMFLLMGGGVFWVLLDMERDPLLSRLEGTQAGQLNKGFYLKLLKYGLVPVLTVIGSQIPSVSNFLLTKLQPTLEIFR